MLKTYVTADGWVFHRDGGLNGRFEKDGWNILSSDKFIIVDPKGNRRAKTYMTLAKAKAYCEDRM